MKAEVVTIGTELLLGDAVDTNGPELSRALATVGIEVARRTAVADDPAALRAVLDEALARTPLVITTGGLGPTEDDLTVATVAQLPGRPLVHDPAVLAELEARFRRFERPMPAINRRQADVPQGATVLPNPRGTAPGLWLDDGARTLVLLPGPPPELRGVLAEELLPRLAARSSGRTVRSHTLRTTGVAESALADRLGPLAGRLAPLEVAWLPGLHGVDIRLTARGLAPDAAQGELARAGAQLADALGEDCYGEGAVDLAAVVLDRLRGRRWHLAVAESCTGGLLGQRVTAVPGASAVFLGGVIAYHDEVKREQLGVPADVLARHGAVSGETAAAMAGGAARVFGAECALAVTGVAGPAGGTSEKPVGTVWLAVESPAGSRTVRRMLPGARDHVRQRAAQAALDLLRRTVGGA